MPTPNEADAAPTFDSLTVKKGKNQAKECKFRTILVENSSYEVDHP
jgi:hypothetical protein